MEWNDDPFADLGAPTQNAPAQSVAASDDPFASIVPRETQQAAQEESGGVFDAIGDTLLNAGKRGVAMTQGAIRDTLNIPHKIAPGLIPAYRPDYDYYKAMGLDKTVVDSLGEGLLGFLPFGGAANKIVKGAEKLSPLIKKAVEKAPNLIKGSLASSMYGAVEAPEGAKGIGAGVGALTGAAGVGAGKLGDLGFRWGLRKYAQSGIPGLVEHAGEAIKKNLPPSRGAQILQKNFNVAKQANTKNWQAVDTVASSLDEALKKSGQKFNGSRFIQDINKGIKDISKKDPAIRAQYEHALGFANYIKEQTPQSFAGVVALRQNLNGELKKYMEKTGLKLTDAKAKQLVTTLKKSLGDVLEDNKSNVPEGLYNQFTKNWDVANKSHTALQEFYKRPTAEGYLKPMKGAREALEAGKLEEGALSKYFRPSVRGTEAIEQLKTLTGSHKPGRATVMRDIIEGRGTKDALDVYEKLSPVQRETLFKGTPYGKSLEAAEKLKQMFGRPKEEATGIGHHIGAYGIPGVLGYGAAAAMGANWHDALMAGIGAGLAPRFGGALTRKIAGKKAPEVLLKAAAKGQRKSKAGKYIAPATTVGTLDALFPERD